MRVASNCRFLSDQLSYTANSRMIRSVYHKAYAHILRIPHPQKAFEEVLCPVCSVALCHCVSDVSEKASTRISSHSSSPTLITLLPCSLDTIHISPSMPLYGGNTNLVLYPSEMVIVWFRHIEQLASAADEDADVW